MGVPGTLLLSWSDFYASLGWALVKLVIELVHFAALTLNKSSSIELSGGYFNGA